MTRKKTASKKDKGVLPKVINVDDVDFNYSRHIAVLSRALDFAVQKTMVGKDRTLVIDEIQHCIEVAKRDLDDYGIYEDGGAIEYIAGEYLKTFNI